MKQCEWMNKQNDHLEKSYIAFITAIAVIVLLNKYTVFYGYSDLKESIPSTF